MAEQDKMLEAVAIFDEACLYEDFEEGGALYVNNSMIKDNEDPDYKDVTFGVMDKATGKRGLVNMTVLAEYVDAGEDKSIVPVDAYGQNEVWNDSGKWSVHGLDLGDYVGGYAQHVAEMQVSETQIQAGHGNFLRVADSMIADIPGDINNHKIVTLGLMDGNGKKTVGTVAVPWEDMDPDWDAVSLPESQRATYVGFASDSNYLFHEIGGDMRSMRGSEIIEQGNVYARNNLKEKQAPEAQAQAGQDKMREAAAPWKSGDEVVNFLHVNNSMIKDTENPDYKDSSLFKDVTFGVMDPETGKKGLVTVTVMNGDVIADTKPQAKGKSYVALDAYPEYTVRNDYGEWVVNGADLARYSDHYAEYMAEKAAEKQAPEAQAQAGQKKPATTNLLRVNDSMIKDTKRDGLKAVTIGLRDADGKEKLGTIFVGDKQVNSDKNTTELPKSQQKGALF